MEFCGGGGTLVRNIKQHSVQYDSGEGKDIILLEDYAIGFYYEQRIYERAKRFYEEFKYKAALPFADIVSFCDTDRSVIMERINGIQYYDKEHICLVIDYLCRYAQTAPSIFKDNGWRYLQHGDMQARNIIWTDDTDYVFIDLDNLGYHPLMYDVLHLCFSVNMSLRAITETIESNSEIIKVIFDRFGIDFNNNYLDSIYFEYVNHYYKMGKFFEDIMTFYSRRYEAVSENRCYFK